jgi:hypothetical protein
MKWMASLTIVCFILAALFWFPGRGERECVLNLSYFDHLINCPGAIGIGQEAGMVSNGVWNQEWILNMTTGPLNHTLRCPVSGAHYVLTFKIGEHPYCPTHGHLIEKYGVRHHQPWLHWTRFRVSAAGTLTSLVAAGISASGLMVMSVMRRK